MTLEQFYDGIIDKAKDKESFAVNGWNSRRSQYRRFAIASAELGVRSNDSVFDVGCGNADLYWYLHNLGIDVNYTGIDIVPKMFNLANESLKTQTHANAELGEFVGNGKFDKIDMFHSIFCIGTVGAIVGNSQQRWEYVRALIYQGLKVAQKGLAITFLTDRDGKKVDDGYHWFVPFETVMENMSRIVPSEVGLTVRADYHPHDVMFVLKNKTY